ncbi:ENR1 protein, partial [Bucco capensis]|nr:ENR1 protein [Bucco capensis]
LYLCNQTGVSPYHGMPEIYKFWENLNTKEGGDWKAPDGLFWICGKRAYTELPKYWMGICTLGIIQPGFFLLSSRKGDELGIPV